jgi:hypothetical protein
MVLEDCSKLNVGVCALSQLLCDSTEELVIDAAVGLSGESGTIGPLVLGIGILADVLQNQTIHSEINSNEIIKQNNYLSLGTDSIAESKDPGLNASNGESSPEFSVISLVSLYE